jgi:chemotaxis family two-component system response regulator Rcp1
VTLGSIVPLKITAPQKLTKVLLVEDNPGDVLLMRKALSKAGASCALRIAEDGVTAIAALADGGYAPDLVLLDLNLPRKCGKEVLKSLKSDIRLRRIPVIVLSSSSSPEDIGACYDMHANGYMVKPGNARAYAEMVRSLCSFWFEHASLPMC